MKRIYLDNAATTKTDEAAIKAMIPFYAELYGNPSSFHDFGLEAKDAVEKSRKIIAKSINADENEIVFTSGGTESDNLAIKGIAHANKDKGNHIITSKIEHHAILYTCNALEKEGFNVTYVNVDEEGIVKFDEIEKAITDKTILISIMHANNEIGSIQPIEKIGEIAKRHNVLFHTDAVQSFTKEKIDVKKTNVDLISFSSHKIHGPKGVGALFIKKGTKLKKLSDGGHHEFNKRAGTENVPGIVGFAKAVEISKKENIEKIRKLRDHMIQEILKKIPDTKLNGSKTQRLANNINISFKYLEGESLLLHLNNKGIAVSTGSACTSDSLEPSHVITSIGVPHEEAHGSIRFTLSKYTTKEEIDYTVKNLVPIVKTLRQMSPLKSGKIYSEIKGHHHC